MSSLRRNLYKGANTVRRQYWKVARPETDGVKAFIVDPTERMFALVRHSYAEQNVAALPGGKYKPRKESAVDAATREVKEELGLTLVEAEPLSVVKSDFEGKRDTIVIVSGLATSDVFDLNDEIAEAFWVDLRPEVLDEIEGPISRFARLALEKYFE